MILTAYTIFHVVISLAGIVSGFVVLIGLLTNQRLDAWTKLFLASTVATSVTGFFFPFHGITPAVVLGIISLLVLAVAIFARYSRNLAGAWRKTYVISAVLALYFNVFVLVVQFFQKVPALKDIAPTQHEPPFQITQLIVLIIFVALGVLGALRFRAQPATAADPAQSTSHSSLGSRH